MNIEMPKEIIIKDGHNLIIDGVEIPGIHSRPTMHAPWQQPGVTVTFYADNIVIDGMVEQAGKLNDRG